MSASLSTKSGVERHIHTDTQTTLFIPAFRKQKQGDFYEFENKVVFVESSDDQKSGSNKSAPSTCAHLTVLRKVR